MLAFQNKDPGVLSHWFTLVDNFQHSAQDFYKSVEDELKARQAPGLAISRVEFHEGGGFSHKRVYLHLARERFAFDLCAAPFGRAYFFSLRFLKVSEGLKGLIFAIGLPIACLMTSVGLTHSLFWGLVVAFLALVFVLLLVHIARPPEGATPGIDVDGFIMRLPFWGFVYERYVRKDTFYRQDTRLMYHTLVLDIVKKKVEEATAAKGVKLIRTYERSPILGDLYKSATVDPRGADAAAGS